MLSRENSPGWLGWGIACCEVSRQSGITGQTEREGRRLAEGGHVEGMAGLAPYLKSRLVSVDLGFWTLTALTVDRESGHFLAAHTITQPCLSQRHPSLSLSWKSVFDSMLWCMWNAAKPLNTSTSCLLIVSCIRKNSLFHKANMWLSSSERRYAPSLKLAVWLCLPKLRGFLL